MLVRGALVAVHGNALADFVALQIQPFAEGFHNELLEVFGKEHQGILVGKNHHVLFPLAAGGLVPGQRQLHGGVAFHAVPARLFVHQARAFQQFIHVHALKHGGNQPHHGHDGGAAAHPVFHREALEPAFRLSRFVQPGTRSRDGNRLGSEFQPVLPEEILGHQHAVAGFRRAAGFGNNDDKRFFQREGFQHPVHAVRVRVVQKEHVQPRRRNGVRHQLRTKSGTADADDEGRGILFRAGRRYFAVQNVPSKGFDVRQGTINGRLQFRRGSQGGVAQPVVPHHAFFIRIGNGAGFQRLHVGKRLVYPPLHGRQERIVQRKFGKIKGDAQFRVANELLCV